MRQYIQNLAQRFQVVGVELSGEIYRYPCFVELAFPSTKH